MLKTIPPMEHVEGTQRTSLRPGILSITCGFSTVSSKSRSLRDLRAEEVAGYVKVEGRRVRENGGALLRKLFFLCCILAASALVCSKAVFGLLDVDADGPGDEEDPTDESSLSSQQQITLTTL